jgi:hypothetical protein
VENRGTGTTDPYDFTILIGEVLVALERKAISTDPLRGRVQGILASPFSCNGGAALPPPPSQVLLHQPVDTSIENAPPGTPQALWEANTAYRADLKPKGGPSIHRDPFHPDDVTALKPFTEGGFSSGAWVFAAGGIALAGTAVPGVRYYAVFGETGWDHVQISLQLDPQGAAAGAAIGVQTSASGVTGAMLALVDEANGLLKVQKWQAGALQDEQQTAIPVALAAPYQLALVAYDDQLEVRLDEAKLVVERGAIRSGQLALVGQDGGSFQRLVVEALDAYIFNFQSSRFTSFGQHIQSADSRAVVIPGGFEGQDEAQIIQSEYATTSAEMARLMQPGADAGLRLSLFQRWAEALSLPLVQQPQGLVLSRLETAAGTALMLLDSPEPLRFSDEVVLTVERKILQPEPVPLPPGLGALQRSIPAGLEALEGTIREQARGVRAIDIRPDRVTLVIARRLLQTLPQAPRFALVALTHEGRLKHSLFALAFSAAGQNLSRVTGILRDQGDFDVISQRLLIRAVSGQIRRIQANELFLLNNQGMLVKKVTLPDLTLPFFAPQPFRLLSNGDETRALLAPLSGPDGAPALWSGGKYRFHFKLTRQRYPQELPDPQAVYAREVEMELEW